MEICWKIDLQQMVHRNILEHYKQQAQNITQEAWLPRNTDQYSWMEYSMHYMDNLDQELFNLIECIINCLLKVFLPIWAMWIRRNSEFTINMILIPPIFEFWFNNVLFLDCNYLQEHWSAKRGLKDFPFRDADRVVKKSKKEINFQASHSIFCMS